MTMGKSPTMLALAAAQLLTPTGRLSMSRPEMQNLAAGMLVRKDGEHVPLAEFIDVDFSEIEKRVLAAQLMQFQGPFSYQTPYDDIEWRAPRADRRLTSHSYGSGGRAYTTSKGRSKDARKARAATRKSRK